MRLGWIERVTLPELGLVAVAAKIDTGARTSALHVLAARPVPSDTGEQRRLVVVLPGRSPASKRRTIEVEVEDWVIVRDTSGRRERRPVIRTTLKLGRQRRVIRLSLTDRGDMRYRMLVGRSALPPGALVDPHSRNRLAAATVRNGGGKRASAKI